MVKAKQKGVRGAAGKAGKYGKSIKKDPLKAKDGKSSTNKKFTKKKIVPKSGKKALVSKEVMDALKENRKEKKEKRERDVSERKNQSNKKKKPNCEPAEPLKKKALKEIRKAHDNVDYENITKIKKLWEKGREKELETSKKQEIIVELKKLMEGKIASLMFKHDLARVVQMILKFGKREHKNFIVEELKPHIQDLAKSKYSKFTVNCMLKHTTPDQRNAIFKTLSGHFKKLTLHANSVSVVDTLYNDYATSKQRTEIITEFYGKEFYLFRDVLSEHLSKVLEVHPDKKSVILEELLKLIGTFIEKGLTGYIVVQHLMLQYFLYAEPQAITELLTDKLVDQVVNFVHTKEGSKIAMRCLWYGTAKHRKLLIKNFKGHIKEMAVDENGYLVLCALFDCVDDTVLVKKAVLTEIMENLDVIVMTAHGRNLVTYLLAGRAKLNPALTEVLSVGDSNPHSKKNAEVRRQEILTHISPLVVQSFSENLSSLLLEKSTSLLITTALTYVNCDTTSLLTALSTLCRDDSSAVDELTTHIVLRNILQSTNHQKVFTDTLVTEIPLEKFKEWCRTNRGAFTVLRMVEHKSADQHQSFVEGLKNCGINECSESVGRDKLIEFLNSSD